MSMIPSGLNPILDVMRTLAMQGLNPAGVPTSGGPQLYGGGAAITGMPIDFTHPVGGFGNDPEYLKMLASKHLSPDMVDPFGEIKA